MSLLLKFVSAKHLRQLALWLLRGLEQQLDPELKARLEQYRRDREAVEAEIAVEEKAIAEASSRLAQIQTERASVQSQIAKDEAAIQTSKERVKQIDEEPIKTSNPDDDDLLHRDFRGSGAGANSNR